MSNTPIKGIGVLLCRLEDNLYEKFIRVFNGDYCIGTYFKAEGEECTKE